MCPRLPTSDFPLPTSDFRLPTSDFRLTYDFCLLTSDLASCCPSPPHELVPDDKPEVVHRARVRKRRRVFDAGRDVVLAVHEDDAARAQNQTEALFVLLRSAPEADARPAFDGEAFVEPVLKGPARDARHLPHLAELVEVVRRIRSRDPEHHRGAVVEEPADAQVKTRETGSGVVQPRVPLKSGTNGRENREPASWPCHRRLRCRRGRWCLRKRR